jgi:murein DD-endopeptidase MepM/ murein hydrolase activator NlpD
MRVLRDVPKDRWGYLNLGAEGEVYRRLHHELHEPVSSLLKPQRTQTLLDRCHRRDNIDASYGGWIENRYRLWQGSYLDEGEKYTHLGVDFTVPARTKVYATQRCRVVRVGDDPPRKDPHYLPQGGWGPHIVARLESGEGYLIYAHLLKGGVVCTEGELLHPGDCIALVGKPAHNGGWFSHLHVQFILPDAGEYYLPRNDDKKFREARWAELDGYCNERDLTRMVKWVRDPLPWVA